MSTSRFEPTNQKRITTRLSINASLSSKNFTKRQIGLSQSSHTPTVQTKLPPIGKDTSQQLTENQSPSARAYVSRFSQLTQASSNPQLNTLESPTQQGSVDSVKFYTQRTLQGISNGVRKINQDSVCANSYFCGQSNRYLFGVCDGHGTNGHLVSQFVVRTLPRVIESQIRMNIGKSEDMSQCDNLRVVCPTLTQAHRRLAKDLNKSHIDTELSGTTCVSVLISGSQIWCSNIGDSRAVYYSKNPAILSWTSKNLSNDHKPDRPTEYQRIMASKGRVSQIIQNGVGVGPQRVWLKEEDTPGLAMSRSLGDQQAHTVGVSGDPEIFCYKPSRSGFLLIASDGIWDKLENYEICVILEQYQQDGQQNLEEAADHIMNTAASKWEDDGFYQDDISLVLVYFETQLE